MQHFAFGNSPYKFYKSKFFICLWGQLIVILKGTQGTNYETDIIQLVTQSKFQTITISVKGKFNCITVDYNGTRQSIYIILEVYQKFIIRIPSSLSIKKNLQKYTHGNRNIFCDAKQAQQKEYLIQNI